MSNEAAELSTEEWKQRKKEKKAQMAAMQALGRKDDVQNWVMQSLKARIKAIRGKINDDDNQISKRSYDRGAGCIHGLMRI